MDNYIITLKNGKTFEFKTDSMISVIEEFDSDKEYFVDIDDGNLNFLVKISEISHLELKK